MIGSLNFITNSDRCKGLGAKAMPACRQGSWINSYRALTLDFIKIY